MIQPVLNSMNRVRTLCGCSIRLCSVRSNALALAYRAADGPGPFYTQDLVKPHAPCPSPTLYDR